MSRIGKQQINIPSGVSVVQDNGYLIVKGPKGELKYLFNKDIVMNINNEKKIISLNPTKKAKKTPSLWGTYAAIIKNMIKGVTDGFEKSLQVEGIGFKAFLEGKDLTLTLGFSHPIKIKTPPGIDFKVEKNKITVSGIDKELVGNIAAKIRAFKKPEPYKGKGIRYENEAVRRKAGKKAIATAI